MNTVKARTVLAVIVTTVLVISVTGSALASHGEVSLPGSNFEIDVNANLKVDDPAPSIDWASVSETRRNDAATGTNDDSYAGGAKEDDSCPGTTTGSIPNNKSDLLTFGAYVEPESGGPGFLNLFWARVQEPSGTTLMDFELNHSSTLCANGVNPVRTAGDLLIEYRIEQGGAVATIKVREWTGSAWGPALDLTGTQAVGTINSTSIPAAESDGLISSGSLSPRTFGEAQLDLDFVFNSGKCESFGSAFLKSRASDSFTSQLKDFIKPIPVNITNCGKVVIRKETNPEEDPNTTSFGYTKSFSTDPASGNTFQLKDDGNQTFTNVLFGTGYTVVEDSIPSGWVFESLDCSASTGVTPSITNATVTFSIDNAADILDCTYTNRQQLGAIKVNKTSTKGDSPLAGAEFSVSGPSGSFTLTTDSNGEACVDQLGFGDYTVTETAAPDGYAIDDGSAHTVTVSSNSMCGDGNEVTLSFSDTPLSQIQVIFTSLAGEGVTVASIECEDSTATVDAVSENGDPDPAMDDTDETFTNLPPDTYTCIVIVDP